MNGKQLLVTSTRSIDVHLFSAAPTHLCTVDKPTSGPKSERRDGEMPVVVPGDAYVTQGLLGGSGDG